MEIFILEKMDFFIKEWVVRVEEKIRHYSSIILDENETSTVLTFHFANEDDYKKLNDLSRDPEDRKRRHEINSKDEDLKKYNLVWEQERVEFNNRKNGV